MKAKPLVSLVLEQSKATEPIDRFVLVAIASYVGNNGCCWPSIDTLANDTGYSRRTVERAIERLQGRGKDPRRLSVPELVVELHGAPLTHLPWQHRPNAYVVRLYDDTSPVTEDGSSPDSVDGSSPVTRDGSDARRAPRSKSPDSVDGSSPVYGTSSPVRGDKSVPSPVTYKQPIEEPVEVPEEPPRAPALVAANESEEFKRARVLAGGVHYQLRAGSRR